MNTRDREHAIDLMYEFSKKELKVRYRRTLAGYAWSVLQPLAFAVVYYMVFAYIFRFETEIPYPLYIILSVFIWQWFGNAIPGSCMSLVGNASLIKQVSFPLWTAVAGVATNDVVHFLLTIPVMLIAMMIYGFGPQVEWIYLLPTLLVLQFGLTIGISLALSVCNLMFRDLERLTGIFLLMLFHLTPVVYPSDFVWERAPWLMYANPMAAILESWRTALVFGEVRPLLVLAGAGHTVLWIVIGGLIYTKFARKAAEHV